MKTNRKKYINNEITAEQYISNLEYENTVKFRGMKKRLQAKNVTASEEQALQDAIDFIHHNIDGADEIHLKYFHKKTRALSSLYKKIKAYPAKQEPNLTEFKKKVREELAKYMWAEGCSCCRNNEEHAEAKANLAKMLGVKKYSDGSGYNFEQYLKQN